MRKTEQNYFGLYFLLAVITVYIIIAIFKPTVLTPIFKFLILMLKRIIPILFVVFVLMILVNYFVSPKNLLNYLGKNAGMKGWLIAIIGGILSTGLIYAWYPMLNDLQKQGVRNRFIATFLYNRAVKPALLPLLIFYFGLMYTLVLTVVMVVVSIFQGIIVEKFSEAKT